MQTSSTTSEYTLTNLSTLDKLAKIDDKCHSSAIVFAILANAGKVGQTLLQITRLVPATTDVNFALLQLDKIHVLVRPTKILVTAPIPVLESKNGKDERDDTLERKHADTTPSVEYDPTWVLGAKTPFMALEQYWSKTPILDDKLFRRLLRELSTRPISTVIQEQKQEPVPPFTSQQDGDEVMGTSTEQQRQRQQQQHRQDHVDGQPSYTSIYSATGKTPLPSSASWFERVKDDLLYGDPKTSVSIGYSTKLDGESTDSTSGTTRQEDMEKSTQDTDIHGPEKEEVGDEGVLGQARSSTERPHPLLILRHKPLLDDNGMPVQRKNVAYVVRPMTYDQDASAMANELASRVEMDTDTGRDGVYDKLEGKLEGKMDDMDMTSFNKCPPEPIYKPVAALGQTSASLPSKVGQKWTSLSIKTRIRLQMSMGYTAVFLVLAERKSRGVLLNEWITLLPEGLDYCNGVKLVQSAGLVTSAIHNHYPDTNGSNITSDAKPIKIPKLVLHQEHWNLVSQEARQHVARLVKLRDSMADMGAMVYCKTWDVDNSLAAPFTFKSKTDDPVPYQHTFYECVVKDSEDLQPYLDVGQCCKVIHYDRLVGILRW